jgi:hypothetical protein
VETISPRYKHTEIKRLERQCDGRHLTFKNEEKELKKQTQLFYCTLEER